LTGFRERANEETRRNLEVVDLRLYSKVNGHSYGVGVLETPTLAELRLRAVPVVARLPGRLRVSNVVGDVRKLHAEPAYANALFQVASQFNLLEMTGPDVTPEDGVTRYEHDLTQGPACAIAAGAATIYRNYFAEVDGGIGQTRDRQIDCLRDVGELLGNRDEKLWSMRNGYALCSEDSLAQIDRTLQRLDADHELGALRDQLRIGLHWNVEVTDPPAAGRSVSQAFCSALPVSYTNIPAARWRAFAKLVLEGAYEATLWAAVLNAHLHGSPIVLLTRLGGGAFGNEASWIDAAMRRALEQFREVGLDVRIVSFGRPGSIR
jgi:hypothetical protein